LKATLRARALRRNGQLIVGRVTVDGKLAAAGRMRY
jgi:hypothetical protein